MFQVGEAGEFEAPKYFNRSLYFRGKQRKTFEDAQKTCLKYDATLTDSSSSQENQFLFQNFQNYLWLNARRTHQKKVWKWLSGPHSGREWTVSDTWIYQNWYPGQPNEDVDCLLMYIGKWYDVTCTDKYYFVCIFTI